MRNEDGPPYTNPSQVGSGNEPQQIVPVPQLPQQLPLGELTQSNYLNTIPPSTRVAQQYSPFQHQSQNSYQNPHQNSHSNSQSNWQETIPKQDHVPVRAHPYNEQAPFTYIDVMNDPRTNHMTHPNYVQDHLKTNFNHSNYLQQEPPMKQQRLSSGSNSISTPVNRNLPISYTEANKGTSFSAPAAYPSMNFGHFQPPPPPAQHSFVRGPGKYISEQHMQMEQPQFHQQVPMFPPQQKPQGVILVSGPGGQYHHPLNQQYTNDNEAIPMQQESFIEDQRSRPTTSQHQSFDGSQGGSIPQTTFEQPYPGFMTNGTSSTMNSSLSSGATTNFTGVAAFGTNQVLPENYIQQQTATATTGYNYMPQSDRIIRRLSSTNNNLKKDESKNKSKKSKNDSLDEVSESSDTLKGRRLRCFVCGRSISRDLSRHMRIHEDVSRFRCIYPRDFCSHKTGFFNRQYDFKKHLLHYHFTFEDTTAKKYNSLNEKLPFRGSCQCGVTMTAADWLSNHILLADSNGSYTCPDLKAKWAEFSSKSDRLIYDPNFDGNGANSVVQRQT